MKIFQKTLDKPLPVWYNIDRKKEREDFTMTINFTLIDSNDTLNFYIAKLPAGWFAFACEKGRDPHDPEGRSMGGFSTKKVAVNTCHNWAQRMK